MKYLTDSNPAVSNDPQQYSVSFPIGTLNSGTIDLTQLSFPATSALHRPASVALSSSYLEHFIKQDLEHGSPKQHANILDQFDDYLIGTGRSENTRKAYNTDISQALVLKLFHYYDFDCNQNPIAEAVLKTHALIELDKELKGGRVSRDQADKAFANFLIQINVHDARIEPLASSTRCQMSLRKQTEQPSANMLNKIDRMALTYIFRTCAEVCDPSFWKQFFSVTAITQILSHLRQHGNDANTIARKQSSYREFEKFLFQSGLVEQGMMVFLPNARIRRKAQISLPEKQIDKIKAYLNQTLKSELAIGSIKDQLLALRNRAIFATLYYTGIRASALCGLAIHDYNRESKELVVNEKGRKSIIKPIDGWGLEWLEDFLAQRPAFLRQFQVPTDYKSPLFHSRLGKPLQSKTLWRILKETAERAGVSIRVGNKTTFGPHAARRSRGAELMGKGARLEQVQEFFHHASADTTRRYTGDVTCDQRKMLKETDKKSSSTAKRKKN